jgi:hypothetical protein
VRGSPDTLCMNRRMTLACRIVGVERLTKGIGFSPEAVREGFVFHGGLARSLKFIPQALDECQTLEDVVGSWACRHARAVSAGMAKEKSRAFAYAHGRGPHPSPAREQAPTLYPGGVRPERRTQAGLCSP